MWDLKRQIIWLVVGISFGTFIVYMDAHDESGRFEADVFAFWEIVLLAIILTLFSTWFIEIPWRGSTAFGSASLISA